MASCKFMTCKFRKTCDRRLNPWKDSNLCDRFYSYINQDYVKQREPCFSHFGVTMDQIESSRNIFALETKEDRNFLIYKLYFVDHKSVKYISLHLSIPKITIYKFLERVNKRLCGILSDLSQERRGRKPFMNRKEKQAR